MNMEHSWIINWRGWNINRLPPYTPHRDTATGALHDHDWQVATSQRIRSRLAEVGRSGAPSAWSGPDAPDDRPLATGRDVCHRPYTAWPEAAMLGPRLP
jgi:hypothetical protein